MPLFPPLIQRTPEVPDTFERIVRKDIRSANWNGGGDLSGGADASATAGYLIDYATGAAQFQAIYADGSTITDIDAANITSGYLAAARIDADTITADMIDVATLSAVGGPAAQIASAITPEGARTALTLPAFFTGVGTVLLVLLVDPLTAHVMDQALRGERPVSDVTAVTVWQIGGRLAGTLLTQLLLSPLAQLLATLARWLVQ